MRNFSVDWRKEIDEGNKEENFHFILFRSAEDFKYVTETKILRGFKLMNQFFRSSLFSRFCNFLLFFLYPFGNIARAKPVKSSLFPANSSFFLFFHELINIVKSWDRKILIDLKTKDEGLSQSFFPFFFFLLRICKSSCRFQKDFHLSGDLNRFK